MVAWLPVVIGFAITALMAPRIEEDLSYYESLGAPGWRTVDAYLPILKYLDLVPSPERLERLRLDCAIIQGEIHEWEWWAEYFPTMAGERPALPYRCSYFVWNRTAKPAVTSRLDLLMSAYATIAKGLLFLGAWVWINVALIVLAFICCLLAGVLLVVKVYLTYYRGVRVRAPTPVLGKNEVRDLLAVELSKTPIDKIQLLADGKGHPVLAKTRATLETACQQVLLRMNNKIRDVGGSVSRNQKLGKSLHVCFPVLTAADRARVNRALANDVGFHLGHECDVKHIPTYMSYTDFHMPLDMLVRTVTSPTLIITHDFRNMPAKLFDEEATISVIGGLVNMTTRGGSKYTHGYHSWDDEGSVVTKSGAFYYHKVAELGDSIVIYATPLNGDHDPTQDNELQSSVNCYTGIKYRGGRAELHNGEYIMRDDQGNLRGAVSARTVSRVAHSFGYAKRDAKFETGLAANLRARFTQDGEDHSLLPEATNLTVALADRIALAADMSAVSCPTEMNFFQRVMWNAYFALVSVLPTSLQLARTVRQMLLQSEHVRFRKWMWEEVHIPNYLVSTPGLVSLRADAVKASRLFPSPGAATAAPAVLACTNGAGCACGQCGQQHRTQGSSGSPAAASLSLRPQTTRQTTSLSPTPSPTSTNTTSNAPVPAKKGTASQAPAPQQPAVGKGAGSGKSRIGPCNYCKRHGHVIANCRSRPSAGSVKPGGSPVQKPGKLQPAAVPGGAQVRPSRAGKPSNGAKGNGNGTRKQNGKPAATRGRVQSKSPAPGARARPPPPVGRVAAAVPVKPFTPAQRRAQQCATSRAVKI
ncbi:hypothetical protein 1 [Sanxia tombus-like virus 9]|uniref:hypothetical protein 1 n=1 Tax=Sanxia tombus-like virus 9 TaxID=1923393 RepID=UPI00090A9377|nr:hypothetical protein 1 [Sanxia tombus-like virus 9]APG76435.1 hypothetical protein 1 [Sanxia tombus-like virus 9]